MTDPLNGQTPPPAATAAPLASPRRPFHPSRAQVGLCGLLLVVICGACLAVDCLANSPRVAAWMMRRELREWKDKSLQYQHKIYFSDFEDRLLLEELPHTDFSQGGVYFFGASNVKVSIMPWNLSDDLRRRVGNYGLSASTPAQQSQFLHYLVEYKGLAEAGEKNLIVFGLFYGTAVNPEKRLNADYLPELFRRHGLFTYDPAEGIKPVPMSDLERTVRIEKARCAGFLAALRHGRTRSSFKPTKHDPEGYRQFRTQYMGDNWRQEMAVQTAEFGRLLDYLHDHHLRVMVIYMPLATWNDPMPQPEEFRRQTESLCRSRGVPIADFTRLLPDCDFYDSTHANYNGQQKLHQAMLEIVERHLRQVDGR